MTNSRRLTLSEDLTIYHALEQKKILLDALAVAGDLELDLMQVGDIDTAGLQLLILLKREAHASGKRVAIVAHSKAVRSAIDFCNLAAELGDPLVIPAAEATQGKEKSWTN
jgi:anti-anti-sigma factor